MRLIDADALEAEICATLREVDDINGAYILNALDGQPSIPAMPVVHGRWVKSSLNEIMCSVCGARYDDEIEYMPRDKDERLYAGLEHCPHCCAKMDLEETT